MLTPFLLLETNHFAILPRLMAKQLAALLSLEARPLDCLTADLNVGLTWSQLQDVEPSLRWFRMRAEQAAHTAFSQVG